MAFTPLDPWLIEDRTYYVVEIDGVIRASGGWSHRAPMIHVPDMDQEQEPPEMEGAASIRAMYTDPAFARRGLGQMLLGFCEMSARLSGHHQLQLIATPVGERLYERCGYTRVGATKLKVPQGVTILVTRMEKVLTAKPEAIRSKAAC
ncbi:GNAT family N-acetyltransferase [Ruegeria sp. 2205SS24-7]|uniref:GNAT family N-acetyltransferase n=1 Tax=Ruegeria discodermiae TaxID=3064389 RepID=UPI0027421DD3|nr:GNAT family N-acetyltransferase [Ruegeria sp. 2205SS24-7]MDP5220974.1 GNAT family N-acetyltransferase [Ruegeria sp. 2205SS24-7]